MIQIKHKITGEVLLEGDFKTIKELINANSNKVLNLRGANLRWADGYYCGSAGHVSQESVKRYIQEQEGKKVFDYDIFECPEELKGQLKIGDFFG
jgi:REP element-mobilizing transposase RayT